jgi:mono/diheme cytochrome c family protein
MSKKWEKTAATAVFFIGTLLMLMFFQNCGSEYKSASSIAEDNNPKKVTPTFDEMQAVVFSKHCNSCHNADAAGSDSSSIHSDFSSYQSMLENSLIPGDPDGSPVFNYVYYDIMPMNADPLTVEEKDMLYTWIEGGAPGPGEDPKDPTDPTTPNGPDLYEQRCASCHGDLARSSKRGATAFGIQNAIDNNVGQMGSLSFLTTAEVQAIADALQ